MGEKECERFINKGERNLSHLAVGEKLIDILHGSSSSNSRKLKAILNGEKWGGRVEKDGAEREKAHFAEEKAETRKLKVWMRTQKLNPQTLSTGHAGQHRPTAEPLFRPGRKNYK